MIKGILKIKYSKIFHKFETLEQPSIIADSQDDIQKIHNFIHFISENQIYSRLNKALIYNLITLFSFIFLILIIYTGIKSDFTIEGKIPDRTNKDNMPQLEQIKLRQYNLPVIFGLSLICEFILLFFLFLLETIKQNEFKCLIQEEQGIIRSFTNELNNKYLILATHHKKRVFCIKIFSVYDFSYEIRKKNEDKEHQQFLNNNSNITGDESELNYSAPVDFMQLIYVYFLLNHFLYYVLKLVLKQQMQINLTKKRAEERYASVEPGVKYNIFFCLEKGKDYSGIGQYDFTLKDTKNVFFDFSGKEIVSACVNSKQYTSDQIKDLWQNGHLEIPESDLQIGENQVSIKFNNQYNNDGNGLHSSVDAKGGQYMYIQSEPFWINRVFPLFDQPDLKGYVKFHFLAPNEWNIICNTDVEIEEKSSQFLERTELNEFQKLFKDSFKEKFTEGVNYWQFNQTQKMSTYLFSFNVGPYKCVEYDGCDGEAPCKLRIFFNEDLQQYIDVQKRYIFSYYINSIKFYESFFQTPAPWEKYDTIICQEYTVGAMEFPGCITYTDRLIFRCKEPTPNQVSLMGHVIVHEMAHQWFGNLVTMKWWNDLWLNESFADFMCYLCQSHIDEQIPFETTDAWTNMLRRKGWGYQEDQMLTTHPIACEVENTSKADSIFDGITYSKGAAVLKQLYFLIGHDRFSQNLKTYFEKYSFNNATLAQFLAEMEKGCDDNCHKAYNLKYFNQEWIEKAGLNEIEVCWDKFKQGKQLITLKQTAFLDEHPTLRYHKMKVAFFDNQARVVHTEEVILDNTSETTFEIDNKEFAAVLPNHQDWCFIKILLDKESLEYFQSNLSRLENPLTKLLVVRALYDSVKDAKSKATDFIDTMISHNHIEQALGDPIMIQSLADYLIGSLEFIPSKYSPEYKNKLFHEILRCLKKTKDNNDINILKPKLLSCGSSISNIDILKNLYEENYPGLTLDFAVDEKWRIAFRICSSSLYTQRQKNMFVDHLKTVDTSDVGKEWQLAIDGLTTDDQKLDEYFKEITSKDRTLSYQKVEYLLIGFNSKFSRQHKKLKYMEKFYELLPEICNQDTKEICKTLLNSGIPECFSFKQNIQRLQKALPQINPELEFHIRKIQKIIFDMEMIMKTHELYEN